LANQSIAKLEEDNFFNKLILNQLSDDAPDWVSRRKLLRAGALFLALLLLGYGSYRLVRTRHHLETDVPLFARSMAKVVLASEVIDQRLRAQLRGGNLWEAARDLARQCLATLGYDPLPMSASRLASPQPPRLAIQGGWWQRWTLRTQVRRLWRLAYDSRPQRISRQEYVRLLAQVKELKAAAQDGTLHLDGSGESA
jgi:hypothetical protein